MIRVWRSKMSGAKRKKGYSTLYELQHGVQQPQQQVQLPRPKRQKQQQKRTKKMRKYIYRSLAELQIGTYRIFESVSTGCFQFF